MAGETEQQAGLQLLDIWVSPLGKRCRIALAEKGLAYEYLEQDLGNTSELLRRASNKKIPVLLHDGLIILQYVDEAFPATAQALLPEANARGGTRFWTEYVDKEVYDYGSRLWQLKGEPQGQAEMVEILKTLETVLGDKPYFSNEARFGLEDVALMPFTAWFLSYDERFGEFSIEEECPRLAAWAKRCAEREEAGLVLPGQIARAPAPMGSSEAEKPLRRMAASFEQLAAVVKRSPAWAGDVGVGAFARACSNVSGLFGCLGIGFKFAEMDYVSKVDDLLEASKSISTLPAMVELDIQKNTVRELGSHTRNLLRVKRGIDAVKVLFEQTLLTQVNSLRNAAPVAYAQVLAPHHGWAMRMATAVAMYALPSNSQLLKKLNEDEETAKVQMQKFVRSSAPVILYIEDLFTSRNLGIDW